MDPRSAASGMSDPEAGDFVRFCYHRRRVGWPELYDEMCAVASRGLFRGYDADDLAGFGIGFSLFDMPALAVLSGRIVAEEQALRRPVAVMIKPDVTLVLEPEPEPMPIAAMAEATEPSPQSEHPGRDERTFDVPVRLTMVPSGA
ncbi:MAG TPA: hypothetical protein VIL81_00785 [Candidatus Limnocylindrales bacterium]